MSQLPNLDLASLFEAVYQALLQHRERLNRADSLNGNHGDHMVAVFACAVRAAARRSGSLAAAMGQASTDLFALVDNGTAGVYARGLALLALRFEERSVELEELLGYVRSLLEEKDGGDLPSGRGVDVMKALLDALADWERAEAQPVSADPAVSPSGGGMDLGYLFGVGMAYLQARQKGGDRLDVLAETAVSVCPLGRIAHRAESGRLVIRTLLSAMAAAP